MRLAELPVTTLIAGIAMGLFLTATEPAVSARADSDQEPFAATSHRTFDDVDHWVKVFDDPARTEWQRPAEVISQLGLKPGMKVADLGAGTGYFCAYLSRAVGESGAVYAVETEPSLVRHLRGRAETEGLTNVIPVLASLGNPRLPNASIDVILIVDTFHHIDDRLGYFGRVQEMLAPDGRVAIIDWKKKELPVGPAPDHKLRREQVTREMEQAGYELVEESEQLPYQYFLIFRPLTRQ